MEKINTNWIKVSIIAGLICLLLQFLFSFEVISWGAQIIYLIAVIIFFAVYGVFDYYSKNGIYFSLDGITWKYAAGAYFKNWDDINLIMKIDFKFLKLAEIDLGAPRKCVIAIWWPSSNSLIYLNNKYVPTNHELYKMINDYSKKQ